MHTPNHVTQPRTPDPQSVTEVTLSRSARSADPHSFMEAVALGTAGQSGESIPATFRWRLREFVGLYGCSYRDDSMLLGFGDAVIPGKKCSLVVSSVARFNLLISSHLSPGNILDHGAQDHVLLTRFKENSPVPENQD